MCAHAAQTKRPETPEKGCDRERHRRAAHPVGRAHTAHQRDESDESRGLPCTSMGTVEQVAMNVHGLHRMLLRQPGLFSVALVLVGPRTPAAAARIALVWRCEGDLVFSWGEIECLLYDSHQKGKTMIMITKTSGSQVDSPVAEGKRKEGGGRKMRDLHKDT